MKKELKVPINMPNRVIIEPNPPRSTTGLQSPYVEHPQLILSAEVHEKRVKKEYNEIFTGRVHEDSFQGLCSMPSTEKKTAFSKTQYS